MEGRVVQTYQRGSLSGSQLRASVEELWAKFRTDVSPDELQRLGIAADQLQLSEACPFVITEKGQGLTATEVLVTVGVHALSAGSYDILKQAWLKWIAPRLKLRIDDALGPPAGET